MSKQTAPDLDPSSDPVEDSGLSLYAYRIYGHLKHVAGPGRKCVRSVRKLASHLGMCVPKAAQARRELISKKLISTQPIITDEGRFELITILDMQNGETSKRISATERL